MKKLLAAPLVLILSMSHFSAAAKEEKVMSWNRHVNNVFIASSAFLDYPGSGFLWSTPADGNSAINFALVWDHKKYCADKDKDYEALRVIYVDGKPIKFIEKCHDNESLRFIVKNKEGVQFIADKLSHSHKPVEFSQRFTDGSSQILHMPTDGFADIYRTYSATTTEPL